MTARPQLALAFALLTLVTAAVAPAARAQAGAADALFSGFEPWGDWILSVDGKDVPKARISYAKRAQAILVRSAEFPSPVLLDLSGRSAQTVDLMKVSERPDGAIDLLADAALSPIGPITSGKDGLAFTVGAKRAVLRNNPHLTGPQDAAGLIAHDVYYGYLSAKYQPDSAALGRLRGEQRSVRVLTFFGNWCPHCHEHVPLLIKTEQLLDGSKIDFDYYGLPGTGLTEVPEAKKYGVVGVPTAIVLVDGREVGRIPNRGWARPEAALVEILAGGGAAASPSSSKR